jgi:hypothetical protein
LRARLPLMSDPSRTPEQEAPTPEQIDDWADSIRDGIYGDDRMTMTAAGVAIDALHSLKHVAFSLLAANERLNDELAELRRTAVAVANEYQECLTARDVFAKGMATAALGIAMQEMVSAARSSSGETPHVG